MSSTVQQAAVVQRPPLFANGLRRAFARGYRAADFRADLLAGIIVGIIAVPLSMALAIGTGLPPEHGLYTAMVAGAICAATGGSELQITGPTAAFVVILVPIVQQYGLGGLCLATSMAGVMMLAAALLRTGKYVRLVPHPVTLGFTGGIGITIAVMQVKDFFGLPLARLPDGFFAKVSELFQALPALSLPDTAVGVATLALLIAWPKVTAKVPAALVALGVGTSLSAVLRSTGLGEAARIADRFGYSLHGIHHAGIPRTPPLPSLKWFSVGLPATWDLVPLAWALLPSAMAIAALAALESLLSAVVADRMSGRRHDSDSELLGAGLANFFAPFFGGFAATGAIARTAANIRSGARTPLAAIIHTIFVLLAILVLAPVLSQLPMAAMSALLLQVAWNMADAKGIVAAVRGSSREDALVLLTTLSLTVLFDMVVAVVAGVGLATLLFSRRMASVSTGSWRAASATEQAQAQTSADDQALPEKTYVHTVRGPLFFAAGEKAFASLQQLPAATGAVVLDLTDVPVLDASGVLNVQSAVAHLAARDVSVHIRAPKQAHAAAALSRAGLLGDTGGATSWHSSRVPQRN